MVNIPETHTTNRNTKKEKTNQAEYTRSQKKMNISLVRLAALNEGTHLGVSVRGFQNGDPHKLV